MDALTGWHDSRGVLVIISEGQGERLEDSAYDAAIANTTDEPSRILALGNPVRPAGRFYEINQKPGWRPFKISAFDTPNVIAGRNVLPGFPAHDWPTEVEAEYGGRDTSFYQSRVLAEFPNTEEDGLLLRSWIDAAVERDRLGTFLEEAARAAPVLSVDVARYGVDSNVLAVRRGPWIKKFVRWGGLDLMQTVDRIREIAAAEDVRPGVEVRHPELAGRYREKSHAHGRIVVDAVGMGAGVCDRLKQWSYVVDEYVGGAFAARGEKFSNKRTEAFWNIRELLEAGKIAFPQDEKLIEELLALRWREVGGKIQLEPKDRLKSRLGRSPDRADALAMAFASDLDRTFCIMISLPFGG